MEHLSRIDPKLFYTPVPRQNRAAAPPSTPIPIPAALLATASATPASTQKRLRASVRTDWDKINDVLGKITKDLGSLGRFLELLFHNRVKGVADPRSARHRGVTEAFLGGRGAFKMADLIVLMYNHKQSQPHMDSVDYSLHFAPPDIAAPNDIGFARPCLTTWALQLVGPELRRQIGILTKNDPSDPNDTTQLRASTNGRAKQVRLVRWDDLGKLSIPTIASTYKRRARAVWYTTECMGAPMVNGVTVLRKRRPHPTIQVGAISSLTLSRNRYASGYLALPLSVWQFACKAHVDLKRIFSRFGFSVHDSTARACLDSLSDDSLTELRKSVAEGIASGTMRWQIVIDNVQQYCRQRDARLGRQDVLKVGTAATAILLEDCAPGAFNLKDHLDRVMKQERRGLTTGELFDSIKWPYLANLTALHWVRILVTFIPQLAHRRVEVAAALKSPDMTILRLRNRVSVMQPLGTNAEHETETSGMMRAELDFERQMGLTEEAMKDLIFIPRGDGASVAAMWRIKKYLSTNKDDYKAFRNRVPAGPEIWHTRWTMLNTIASNCHGPASSSDPSALSKSATAAGAKRPSNLKKVDFFPASRSMKLFFEARVLDCWRIHFGADDIIQYFERQDMEIPDLESLWTAACTLVRRYASQEAYNNALSKDLFDSASADMQPPKGTPWTAPVQQRREAGEQEGDDFELEPEDDAPIMDEVGEAAQDELLSDSGAEKTKKKKNGKKFVTHAEEPGFDGDRVLANEALFLQDMGMWVIASHAIPDGEIGRVWEVMKTWIFSFSGSTNRNYATYLLETYCLHTYEASPDFSSAMLNNWLVNLTGHKWVECDWSQEDFNKWLEEMVEHKGGDFDDHFYRHTLAPNVRHFLRLKEQMETAFGLKRRGKLHGAPHLRNEILQLLCMFKEDELHLFRSGRSMGFAMINFLERGYSRLDEGRLDNFIDQSTGFSDVTRDVLLETDEAIDAAVAQFMRETEGSEDEPEDDEGNPSDAEPDVDLSNDRVVGLEYSDEEESSDDEPDGRADDQQSEPEDNGAAAEAEAESADEQELMDLDETEMPESENESG